MSRAELVARLRNGLRDHRLYGAETPPQGRRARAAEAARNLAVGLGRATFRGRPVQFRYRDVLIPLDLAEMTGAGSESWEEIARAHLGYYERWTPISPDHAVLEVGCGIGRDALHLVDLLSPRGRYLGLDVTEASIRWCRDNITARHPNFEFRHLDVASPMYNPGGSSDAEHVRFPAGDGEFDLVALHSVFTHMFRPAVTHYLADMARVLRPTGRVLASFFVIDDESLAAAAANGAAQTFRHDFPTADRINDAEHPEAAVGFTRESLDAMADAAGLVVEDLHRGFWSGLHPDAPNGQDVAILRRRD